MTQVHHVAHGCTRNSSRAGVMGGSSAGLTRAAATRPMATANRDATQSLAAFCITATSTVMTITKCLIWVPPVNRFTVTPRAFSQCGRTSDWMARAGLDGQRA